MKVRITINSAHKHLLNAIVAWNSQLYGAIHESRPSQILLLVVDPNRPWAFLLPPLATTNKSPRSPPRTNKLSSGAVFQDVSATTFLVQSNNTAATSFDTTGTISPPQPVIADAEDEKWAGITVLRPISSATLVRVPAGTDYSFVTTLHLHLLRVHSHPSCSGIDSTLLEDIAQNYHDLSILARLRWKLRANAILPFHLAALEVMCTALATDESLTD